MLKSIDFWPLVPKKLSVESSINDDIHQKSMFNLGIHTTTKENSIQVKLGRYSLLHSEQ